MSGRLATTIPKRLTLQEKAAVRHLLSFSALGSCAGTQSRIHLSADGDLTIGDLSSWSWSSGELVLLDVLRFLVGEDVRWPDLSRVDDHERLVVRETLRLLGRDA